MKNWIRYLNEIEQKNQYVITDNMKYVNEIIISSKISNVDASWLLNNTWNDYLFEDLNLVTPRFFVMSATFGFTLVCHLFHIPDLHNGLNLYHDFNPHGLCDITPLFQDNIPLFYDNYYLAGYTINFLLFKYFEYYYPCLHHQYDRQVLSCVYQRWMVKFKRSELRALNLEGWTFDDYMNKKNTEFEQIYNIRNVSRNQLYSYGIINWPHSYTAELEILNLVKGIEMYGRGAHIPETLRILECQFRTDMSSVIKEDLKFVKNLLASKRLENDTFDRICGQNWTRPLMDPRIKSQLELTVYNALKAEKKIIF